MKRRQFLQTFGALSTILALTPRALSAETLSGSTINHVPVVLDQPGIYSLHRNLVFLKSGPAIEVMADNVTIDFNDYQIFSGNFPNTLGVRILGRQNVTVRNGRLLRFACGIYADSCETSNSNTLIEDMLVEASQLAGIVAIGNGSIVQNNSITDFGSNQFPHGSVGILASEYGSLIKNNTIQVRCPTESDPPRLGIGLGGSGVLATENRITNCHLGIGGTSIFGLTAGANQNIVSTNTVVNAAKAFVI